MFYDNNFFVSLFSCRPFWLTEKNQRHGPRQNSVNRVENSFFLVEEDEFHLKYGRPTSKLRWGRR